MCRSASPESTLKNKCANSNVDANTVTIIETINNHGDLLTLSLIIIAVLTLMRVLYKFYSWHKRNIQRNERQRNIAHTVNGE